MEKLKIQSPKLSFFKYAIPSLFGMMLMAVNIVVDGIFVGRILGPVALAGVNIAFPVFSFFLALSLWVSMGATSLYSEAMGEGKRKKAQAIFTQGILLIFGLTILVTTIAMLLQSHLIGWLGANDEIAPYASDYLSIILLFGFVITIENTLSIFVRNDGAPNLAMIALVSTSLANILFNYIFLVKLGMKLKGTALALIASAALGALILSTHFLKKNSNLKLQFKGWTARLYKKVFHVGFPSFLAEVGAAIFIISYNITIVNVAGTVGGAAFSMVSYSHAMALMLFIGLSSSIQPLVSYYRGAGMLEEQKKVRKYAMVAAFVVGLVFIVVAELVPRSIIGVFGSFSPEIMALAEESIRIFFLAYLFMGVNFVMITYFQINGNTNFAILLTGLREIVLVVVFLVILPPLFNTVGVWLAVPLAELCIFCLIMVYSRRQSGRLTVA